MLLQNWKMLGMKKNLIAGGDASSTVLKHPLDPIWSPAGQAGMLWGGAGWWSLIPKRPPAAAMTQLPASRHPATTGSSVPTKEQWLFPLTGQDVTPRCDPCTTTLAAANPLRLPQRAPSHPLTHWCKSPDSFFPPLCLPRERKKEFEIICWHLILHHIQLVLEQ